MLKPGDLAVLRIAGKLVLYCTPDVAHTVLGDASLAKKCTNDPGTLLVIAEGSRELEVAMFLVLTSAGDLGWTWASWLRPAP